MRAFFAAAICVPPASPCLFFYFCFPRSFVHLPARSFPVSSSSLSPASRNIPAHSCVSHRGNLGFPCLPQSVTLRSLLEPDRIAFDLIAKCVTSSRQNQREKMCKIVFILIDWIISISWFLLSFFSFALKTFKYKDYTWNLLLKFNLKSEFIK